MSTEVGPLYLLAPPAAHLELLYRPEEIVEEALDIADPTTEMNNL